MNKYIEQETVINRLSDMEKLVKKENTIDAIICAGIVHCCIDAVKEAPAVDAVDEEDVLKFYYVRSIDEYWIGQRIGNFYYAEYDPKSRQWVWTHSRYLPWGKHVVSPTSLWKEHTYPSEPEEMPFGEWLTGFIKKHIAVNPRAVDVVRCSECKSKEDSIWFPSKCWCRHGGGLMPLDGFCSYGVRKNETR